MSEMLNDPNAIVKLDRATEFTSFQKISDKPRYGIFAESLGSANTGGSPNTKNGYNNFFNLPFIINLLCFN